MNYEKLFKDHGFDINTDKEKFYSITKSHLLDMKLWHINKGGKVEIIKHCFPNEEWLTFKFKQTPWCRIKQERIKYTKFLVKKLCNNNFEKCYSLTRKDIKNNYGKALDKLKEPTDKGMSLVYYLLEEAFPEVEWLPWEFDVGFLYYNEEMERRFIELFEEDNNIKEPEHWYEYNGENIRKSKGDWLTRKYGHICDILISVKPELKPHLKIYNFTSPPNGWFDSLDNLKIIWKDLLEHYGGIDNVQLYGENNKGTFTFIRKIKEKYRYSSTIESICKFHSEYINKNVELYEFTHLWNKKHLKERFRLLEDIIYLQKYVKYLEEKHNINIIDGWYSFDIRNKILTLHRLIKEKYNNSKYEFFKKIYPDKNWKKELFISLINHTNRRFQGSEYSLPIPFEPNYRITLKGDIFNQTSKEIKTLTDVRRDGRVTVTLNDKSYLIYRVMAITFLPLTGNPENYYVDHINSNPHDNTLSNLRWCRTYKENMNNPNTKKKRKDGYALRRSSVFGSECNTIRQKVEIHCFCGILSLNSHHEQSHRVNTGLNGKGINFTCINKKCNFNCIITCKENTVPKENIKIIEEKRYATRTLAASENNFNRTHPILFAITHNTQAGGFLWKNPIIEEIETRKKTVKWKLFLDEYVVFSKGQNKIYSEKRKQYVKGSDIIGYRRVTLKHNKHYSEHKIVAELFIDNPHNKPYVDHKDTNKLNNDEDNLQWVTHKENMNNPNTKKKLNDNPNCGKKIQIMYEDGNKDIIPSLKQCSIKLGISVFAIKRHIDKGEYIEIDEKKFLLSYFYSIP